MELTPVDFVRLMDLAERREMPKGKLLSEENKVQEEVFLIMEGTAEVRTLIYLNTVSCNDSVFHHIYSLMIIIY